MDIGDLDCTIHVGFPGSVCSLRQQAGRCGRNGRPSVSVLVALDSVRGPELDRGGRGSVACTVACEPAPVRDEPRGRRCKYLVARFRKSSGCLRAWLLVYGCTQRS